MTTKAAPTIAAMRSMKCPTESGFPHPNAGRNPSDSQRWVSGTITRQAVPRSSNRVPVVLRALWRLTATPRSASAVISPNRAFTTAVSMRCAV